MENVAHAFAGLLIARLVVDARRRTDTPDTASRSSKAAAWTGVFASNVPDGDLTLTSLTGGKLGYLLHHRGHTHTLPIAVALGLAVAAVVLLVVTRFGGPLTTRERRAVLFVGAICPVVHLAMDAWNVYGVHPFWPLYDGWFYGDAVFILEPLLWIGAAPMLFKTTASWMSRAFYALVLGLGVLLPWMVPAYVPLPIRVGLVLVAAGMIALARRLSARSAIRVAALAFVVVPLVFFAGSAVARGRIVATLTSVAPREQVLDVALSSQPSNPFCYTAVIVSLDGDDVAVRRARVALAPGLVPLATCSTGPAATTAPLLPSPIAASAEVEIQGELRLPRAHLRELAARCDVGAMMRFVRAPFVVDPALEGGVLVGDLRFDRDPGLDFAEIAFPRVPGACPEHVPPWTPPRADLLGP